MSSRPIEALGLNLEDSYLLGFRVSEANLRLRVLFALMSHHGRYSPPKPGEQHAYLEGDIVLEGVAILDWRAGKPNLLRDPDGSLDLGSIDLVEGHGRYRIATEWFELTCTANALTVIFE